MAPWPLSATRREPLIRWARWPTAFPCAPPPTAVSLSGTWPRPQTKTSFAPPSSGSNSRMWSWHLEHSDASLDPPTQLPAEVRPSQQAPDQGWWWALPSCPLISCMAASVPFGLRQLQGRNPLTFGQMPFALITTFMVCNSCHSSHTVPQSPHKVLALALLIGFLVNIQGMYISF